MISSNRLYAFSAETGQLLWRYGDEFGVAYEPALLNGLVIAADDGKLVALSPAGNEVCGPKRRMARLAIASRVSADGGVVYGGGFDGVIRAVDAGDGAFAGALSPMAKCSRRRSRPAFSRQSSTNFVYGLNQADGGVLWKYDTTGGGVPPGQTSNFPPTYANGMVFVPTGIVGPDRTSLENYVLALDAKTGKVLWKERSGASEQPSRPLRAA